MEDELIRYDGIGLGELIFPVLSGISLHIGNVSWEKKSKKMSWNP